MRPFAGPPLPRLEQRDALRRAATCDKAARGSAEERWADRKSASTAFRKKVSTQRGRLSPESVVPGHSLAESFT